VDRSYSAYKGDRTLKPHILLLTSSFPSSAGDETCGYIRDFARSLSSEFNVTVLAPRDRRAGDWSADAFTLTRPLPVLPNRLDPFQASVDLNHVLAGSPVAKLGLLISLLCFLARACRLALQADVICSHWMVPGGFAGALISLILGKPHVVVEHSGALHLLAQMRGGKAIARFVVAGSDRIVTVSGDLRRKLVTMCPAAAAKIDVIPMGVRRSALQGTDSLISSQTARTILFVGRLTEIKGLDVLLRAMEGSNSLKLIVAGDGEKRDELERLSRELSVDAIFVGRVSASEREQLLSDCDAVAIPSRILADGRTEGTPVVCLEALAAGRPVIASRAGGLADVIVDGENGLLFDQGDHRMLKEKLMLALSDDSLRQKISENAQRSAEAYDWPRIGSRFNQIITSSLKRKFVVRPSGGSS